MPMVPIMGLLFSRAWWKMVRGSTTISVLPPLALSLHTFTSAVWVSWTVSVKCDYNAVTCTWHFECQLACCPISAACMKNKAIVECTWPVELFWWSEEPAQSMQKGNWSIQSLWVMLNVCTHIYLLQDALRQRFFAIPHHHVDKLSTK